MRNRYRNMSVRVDADVDVLEVLGGLDKDELLDVLAILKIDAGIPIKEVERIYDRIQTRDYAEAAEICESVLRPKWRVAAQAEEALLKARAPA